MIKLRAENNQKFSEFSENMAMMNSMVLKVSDKTSQIGIKIDEHQKLQPLKQAAIMAETFELKHSKPISLRYSALKSCQINFARKQLKLELFEPMIVENKAIVSFKTFNTFSRPENSPLHPP